MDIVKIHIVNYSKWQKPVNKRREWFALDSGFFHDRKVREARRVCPDSPECFLSLWREADTEGNIELSPAGLKAYWMEVLCIESNRFKIEKRLDALSKAGLITFQLLSNEVLNTSQLVPNDVPMQPQRPLDHPQISAPVISNIHTNKTRQDKTTQKNKFSESDLSTANFILEKIRLLDSGFKPKNIESWANEIRLMVEQDKRTHESIQELYAWVSQDTFWRKVVLSPSKLREKWSQLSIAKNTPGKFQTPGIIPGNNIAKHTERKEGVVDWNSLT